MVSGRKQEALPRNCPSPKFSRHTDWHKGKRRTIFWIHKTEVLFGIQGIAKAWIPKAGLSGRHAESFVTKPPFKSLTIFVDYPRPTDRRKAWLQGSNWSKGKSERVCFAPNLHSGIWLPLCHSFHIHKLTGYVTFVRK